MNVNIHFQPPIDLKKTTIFPLT